MINTKFFVFVSISKHILTKVLTGCAERALPNMSCSLAMDIVDINQTFCPRITFKVSTDGADKV